MGKPVMVMGVGAMDIAIDLEDGFIPALYSKQAPVEALVKGQPVLSFPFRVADIPSTATSLCLVLIDHDAIPVCGFTWIHWAAANIATEGKNELNLPPNFSKQAPPSVIQGKNSNFSAIVKETDPAITVGYIGPTPPDVDHEYTLTAYAVDTMLKLDQGFYLNVLYKAMRGHVVDLATAQFLGRA